MISLTSCISIPEINNKLAMVDRAWLLEYQKMEETIRFRVINAPYIQVFESVRKTALDLGIPIVQSNYETGIIVGEIEGPTPLSKAEWQKVKEIENPKVLALTDNTIEVVDDPSIFILSPKISMTPVKNKTLVSLDYTLSSPLYESMGIRMSKIAPPAAVKIGSDKFWNTLNKRLTELNIPEVNKGNKSDLIREAEVDADINYEQLNIVQNKKLFQTNKKSNWKDSVVTIKLPNSHGTGFAIYDDLILTNKHVVDEINVIKIKTSSGKIFQGDVLRKNNLRDVALIKLREKLPSYFSLNENLPEQGEDVFVIGSPKFEDLHSTLTKGIVSSIRKFDGLTMIQSDVSVTNGNSGGPLINNKGEVIGIVVSGQIDPVSGDTVTGINYFIPTNEALSFLNLKIDRK